MSVTDYAVHTASSILDATGANAASQMSQSALQQLRSLSGLCNAAEFDNKSQHLPLSERTIFGDATDQAILRFSEGLGPVSDLTKGWKSDYTLAFDSKNKFMIKTFTLPQAGSPELSLSPTEASKFQSRDMYVQTINDLSHGDSLHLPQAVHYQRSPGYLNPTMYTNPTARRRSSATERRCLAQGRKQDEGMVV